MKALVIYDTFFGNTQQIAESMADEKTWEIIERLRGVGLNLELGEEERRPEARRQIDTHEADQQAAGRDDDAALRLHPLQDLFEQQAGQHVAEIVDAIEDADLCRRGLEVVAGIKHQPQVDGVDDHGHPEGRRKDDRGLGKLGAPE